MKIDAIDLFTCIEQNGLPEKIFCAPNLAFAIMRVLDVAGKHRDSFHVHFETMPSLPPEWMICEMGTKQYAIYLPSFAKEAV